MILFFFFCVLLDSSNVLSAVSFAIVLFMNALQVLNRQSRSLVLFFFVLQSLVSIASYTAVLLHVHFPAFEAHLPWLSPLEWGVFVSSHPFGTDRRAFRR